MWGDKRKSKNFLSGEKNSSKYVKFIAKFKKMGKMHYLTSMTLIKYCNIVKILLVFHSTAFPLHK